MLFSCLGYTLNYLLFPRSGCSVFCRYSFRCHLLRKTINRVNVFYTENLILPQLSGFRILLSIISVCSMLPITSSLFQPRKKSKLVSQIESEAKAVENVAKELCPLSIILDRVVLTSTGVLLGCWQFILLAYENCNL
ncbi:hypothetical protein Leryth_022552 [Lithospermum erythrorhizon]|nr:hypothetical protein Leryth_022552 [Lithospermum erythrorhizon]